MHVDARTPRSMLLLALAIMLAAACTTDQAADTVAAEAPPPVEAYSELSAGTLAPDDDVPRPEDDDPAVTVEGLIGNGNVDGGDALALDLETLEQLPMVSFEVYEPHQERVMSFDGILLSDVLAVADAEAGAEDVLLTALDDYEVSFAVDDLDRDGVVLATRADGERMEIADGGPTRIVFTEDSEPGEDPLLWIWNVATIDVR